MIAAAITQFIAWVGAVINTAGLKDKTWFIILLVTGLLSFGFIAMIIYLIAGPDDPPAGQRGACRPPGGKPGPAQPQCIAADGTLSRPEPDQAPAEGTVRRAGGSAVRRGDPQFFADPQGAVAVAEMAAERAIGPRGAVVPGQGDDPRPAGLDLLQHVPGVALADRLPGRMRVAEDRLRYQRGPGRVDGQVQLPTTARMGTSRTCSGLS